MRRRRPSQAGFTLLETLVALAILGIVLSTVFGVIGSGLRAAHRDEDRLLLGLAAQNLLERSRLDLTTSDGPRNGDIGGGLTWRIESEPYVLPDDILPPPPDPDAGRGLAAKEGPGDETGSASAGNAVGGGTPSFGSDRAAGGDTSSFGRDRAGQQEPEADGRAGGFGDRAGIGDAASGQDRRTGSEPKEDVRLRLVRVIVEKGGQRFELTGLAMEPRRERSSRL